MKRCKKITTILIIRHVIRVDRSGPLQVQNVLEMPNALSSGSRNVLMLNSTAAQMLQGQEELTQKPCDQTFRKSTLRGMTKGAKPTVLGW